MLTKNIHKALGVLPMKAIISVMGLFFVTGLSADQGIDAYIQKAEKAMKSGQVGQAERLYHRVIYTEPGQINIRLQLIELYISQKRYKEALGLINEGLNLNQDQAELWIKKGYVLRKFSTPRAAQEAYDRAVELAPEDESILRRASGFYRYIGNIGKSRALNQQRKKIANPPSNKIQNNNATPLNGSAQG